MRSRLITLVVLALAAWALMHWAREEDRATPPAAVGGTLYPGLEVDSIPRLGFGARGGDWVEFEREPAGPWRIIRPTDEYAEQEFVEHALNALAASRVLPIERQGIEVDAAAVGLDPPRSELVFELDGVEHALFLGNYDPFDKGLFARRADSDEVLMITPLLRTHMEQFRPEDYVDKSLFRGYAARIVGLRVEGPQGVAVDATREGNGWVVTEPRPGRGDTSRIDKVVRSLQFADQQQVGATWPDDDMLAIWGLPGADARARGELGDATLVELRPENEAPVRLYLQRDWRQAEGVINVLREDGQKLLGVQQREFSALWQAHERPFLDPRFWPALRERATSLSIEVDGTLRLDLRRGARGEWVFRAPERLAGQPVDAELIDGRSGLGDLLGDVDSLRALDFTDPPEGEPRLVLAAGWESAGAYRRETLSVLEIDGERLPARFSGRPAEGFVVGPELRAFLDPFLPERLRGLRPVSVDPQAWVEQHVRLPGRAEPLVLRRLDEREGALGVEGDDDQGRLLGLGLDLAERLTGLTWAPRPDPAPEYPWAVSWYDAQGALLGELQLRRVRPGEDSVVFGLPVVRAVWSGVPEAELVLDESWLGRFVELEAGG